MMATLHSYAVAVRTSSRPRHVLHIHKDGKPEALCGSHPVEFIGDALERLPDTCWLWPYCLTCEAIVDAIDPELMDDWRRRASD